MSQISRISQIIFLLQSCCPCLVWAVAATSAQYASAARSGSSIQLLLICCLTILPICWHTLLFSPQKDISHENVSISPHGQCWVIYHPDLMRQTGHPKPPRQFGPPLPQGIPSGYSNLAQNSHSPLHLQYFRAGTWSYTCTACKQTQNLLVLTEDGRCSSVMRWQCWQ